jgi:hypothetical protein
MNIGYIRAFLDENEIDHITVYRKPGRYMYIDIPIPEICDGWKYRFAPAHPPNKYDPIEVMCNVVISALQPKIESMDTDDDYYDSVRNKCSQWELAKHNYLKNRGLPCEES